MRLRSMLLSFLLVSGFGIGAPLSARAVEVGRHGPAGTTPVCRHADALATTLTRVERELLRSGALLRGPIWFRQIVRSFLSQRRTQLQNCVRMNEVQVLGTHNSYHIELPPAVMQPLFGLSSSFSELQYTHRPLPEQFETLGVRQIELDLYADPQGGLYANRGVLELLGVPSASNEPELDRPGFKVLHITDLDYLSTCLSFVSCLQQIRSWSDAHPGHLPLAVLIELKDDPPLLPVPQFVTPPLITAAGLDALDAEIRSVLPAAKVILPDDVRGPRASLETAVLEDGWLTLGEARGRVIFLMDNGGNLRDVYRAGRPALEGRMLFTNSIPGESDAAFVKLNDPESDPGLIRDVVRRGYLVRTRADEATRQSRSGDTSMREAALASGAQYVSSDYPEPDPRFTSYRVAIPGGAPGRCNPVSAPAWCESALLESQR